MAKGHAVIVIFPILPLLCLTFTISVLAKQGDSGAWVYVIFGLVVAAALVVVLATLHYLCYRPTAHLHHFLWLPLLLSFLAFALCVVAFNRIIHNDDDSLSKWYRWFLTLPACILALVFSIPSAIIVFRDVRMHHREDNNISPRKENSSSPARSHHAENV